MLTYHVTIMYNVKSHHSLGMITESIMQFLQWDGALQKEPQMVVGSHAHQAQSVFHIGFSKILGVKNGGKMVLARLKEELAGSTTMEL